jgi:hypothetical protein
MAIALLPLFSSVISLHFKGGILGLKVLFFLPLLPQEVMIEVMEQTSFSFKRR